MTSKNIQLLSINDVKEFVNTATLARFEIDLVSGRYTVDAKSIMGIFSLDLSKPIKVVANCDEATAADFFAKISALIVD